MNSLEFMTIFLILSGEEAGLVSAYWRDKKYLRTFIKDREYIHTYVY